ncbi:MAG: DNA cytosine methyltransferase [Pikeienuella sp.]
MTALTYYEFFCGGGMARIGLGPEWRCLLANDIDKDKCAAYRANFLSSDDLLQADVHDLTTEDLPDRADLAWASFPCQDLSLAGARGGLTARRSAAFWGYWQLIEGLSDEGRAPHTLVIENVAGFASSKGGRDLALVLEALSERGYFYDIRMIDAADSLPQSRPRLFIIGWLDQTKGEVPPTTPSILKHAEKWLSATALSQLRYLGGDHIAQPNVSLSAIMSDAPLDPAEKTASLLAMMGPKQQSKLAEAKALARNTGSIVWGAGYRRMRGAEQRFEARYDIAGCLRTAAGGSSRQFVLRISPNGEVGSRRITPREAARLMGLPENYKLPQAETTAFKLLGDGVAVPVVRYIAESLLKPLLTNATPLEPSDDGA